MSDHFVFILDDQLPTYYNAALSIFTVASKPNTQKMSSAINSYSLALMNVWTKSFGKGHIMSRSSITKKLVKLTNSYYSQVYVSSHRNKRKHGEEMPTSMRNFKRDLNKKWKTMLTSKKGPSNNSLLDIGANMEKLTGSKLMFYTDQKTDRNLYISEEIDDDFENAEESSTIMEPTFSVNDANNNNSDFDLNANPSTSNKLYKNDFIYTNRSGIARVTITRSIAVQTELKYDCPPMRKRSRSNSRICSVESVSTCATVSSVCGVSPETARLAVKTTVKGLIGKELYLSRQERQLKNPEHVCNQTSCPNSASKNNSPSTCSHYDNVLPSSSTIREYKQLQASQVEQRAALALLNKSPSVKSTLHYDTTSRSSIKGEWPAILLNFSNGQEFVLRPLFLAYEDRNNITLLLAETYYRLADALSIYLNKVIEPVKLWEQTTAIMTDSVSKNLGIEKLIAASLNSQHIPFHLLCKSHTVEKFDETNLKVLMKIENSVQQRQIITSINPSLKSFFRGKKTVVESGIQALISLVSRDKSANSTSLADQFDYICEREGVIKRIFLYQQRRFCKLGKAAAAIIEAYPYLNMLIDEATTSNLLVQACQLYMSSEIFLTELEALAYFNEKVTFPFLHCVEKSSQQELLEILPKLHEDLLNKKLDTLKEFVVNIRGVSINEPKSDVGKKIIDMMCIEGAAGLEMQCGREYGFSSNREENDENRATNISLLSPSSLEGLPTNNLSAERNLSEFDRRINKISKSINKRFTAKGVKNDLVTHKSEKIIVDSLAKEISNVLLNRENEWNEAQKQQLNTRIQEKMKRSQKRHDYGKKLLTDCKAWMGPCTSAEELLNILKHKPDKAKFIVRTEMAFYAHCHKEQKIGQPELFKLNGISYEEKLTNLCTLLSSDISECSKTIADLPTNDDIFQALGIVEISPNDPESNIRINYIHAIIWQNEKEEKEWYLGYIKEEIENEYIVEHLQRVSQGSDLMWTYPTTEDIQRVEKEQILPIEIKGDWNMERKNKFVLKNINDVIVEFKKYAIETHV